MGKARRDALRVNFDRKLKIEFHGVKVTIAAGLLAYREIDDVLGLTDLLPQSVYSRLAGSVQSRYWRGVEVKNSTGSVFLIYV